MNEIKEEKYVIDNAQLMAKWSWEKNNLLGYFPNKIATHSNKKIWWICDKGHSWDRSPDKMLNSDGCPYCLNKRVLVGYNDLNTLFPNIAIEWDSSENKIDINSVVMGSAKDIHWVCSKCQHKWIASVRMRTQRGHGCPECAKKIRAANRTETLVEKNGCITNPHLLKEWDYEKNTALGLFPNHLTPYSNKKACWKCSTCGYEWQTTIANRSAGFSCPVCANRVIVAGVNDLATTHPELANEWDYEANGELLPQHVSYGMGKKVGWKCPLGHKYKATLLHRSSGTNCPICNSGRQTSFAEQAVYYYVKKLYPSAINRYKDIFDNGMELDIYIPELRYGIEYDGSFWHKQSGYEREQKKYEICKSNGIRLIRIKAYAKQYSIEGPHFSDYTLFLKEDNVGALEKLIQSLYFRLCNINSRFCGEWENTIATVNIERDRYKISNYRYEQKDSFADEYPEVAKEWHPTKNEDLTPSMFRSGSSFLAWWLCPVCGYEWKASLYSRSQGSGCEKCSRKNNAGQNHYKARKIYQYTREGIFVREWGAISEASKTLTINQSNMSMCADGKRAIAGGYRWSYEYCEQLPPIQKQHKSRKGINGKRVNQLDLQGNVIKRFISLYEAEEKTGVNATSISKVLNGHIKTAGGFFWEIDKTE